MIRRFLGRWQEPLFWLPGVLALMVIAQKLIPLLDPRSGIDGWGAVWGVLLVAFAALLAAFLAWLFCDLYGLELRDSDERELIDHAAGIARDGTGRYIGHSCASWQAVAILGIYKGQWLLLFYVLFSRFSP